MEFRLLGPLEVSSGRGPIVLVDAASTAGSVVVLRQTVGATLLPGLLVADVPATAVQAIDSLESLPSLLAARTGRADLLTDEAGAVRVILSLPRWGDFVRSFLDDLIAAAADTPIVLLRLRELLARVGEQPPPAGAGIVATRAAWVDESLARKFPVIRADTATTGHGRLTEQPPGSR